MTDPRHAYAGARLHARFARRAGAAQWGALDASRTADHYVDVLRAGRWLHVPEGALESDVDARERWLRAAWRESCTEVATWYGAAHAAAFDWLALLADLDALERLRAGLALPAWLDDDPWLGGFAGCAADVRAQRIAATPYAPLQSAWQAGAALVEAWRDRWHALWHDAPARERRALRELEGAVVAAGALGAAARRDAVEIAAHRAFRRGAGTVAAGVAYLAIVALQLERVRGGLAARALPPPFTGAAA